jgi:hypothetical protein
MTAHEHQPKHIVPVIGPVDRLGYVRFVVPLRHLSFEHGLGAHGCHAPLSADPVEAGIPRHLDQPRQRISRHAVEHPPLRGPQAGFLKQVFSHIQVPKAAHQRGERPRTAVGNDGFGETNACHRCLRVLRPS